MRITQVRAFIVVGFLIIIAITTSWFAIANDSQTAAGREDCEPGDVQVDTTLPEEKAINVKLVNATGNDGLATGAIESLKEYGFNVENAGKKSKGDMDAPVEIRYGPKAVAGGHLMRAYFSNPDFAFSLDNDTDYVSIKLGPGFQQVNTKSDARNALGIIGRPEAPEGTCAIE